MRNLIIGFILGVVVGTTGTYSVLKNKIQKIITEQNVEDIVNKTIKTTDLIVNEK